MASGANADATRASMDDSRGMKQISCPKNYVNNNKTSDEEGYVKLCVSSLFNTANLIIIAAASQVTRSMLTMTFSISLFFRLAVAIYRLNILSLIAINNGLSLAVRVKRGENFLNISTEAR
ncbi:hypothetical protein PoB_002877600 [Plakobranchus ocellatus]|uniref:7TM GPCR serpentine receptor class x (Srx) domain-containing protein n=1 Tax=Plakobranchus ocellatus TaxID=259542 RepID=A0AAV4A278_9GAST|nr:hypothetical protein PoB_002877600 [Plakobranchus ocellatus]